MKIGFRPRLAVAILADLSNEEGVDVTFLKTWALTQLLAWSVLDQRPGKRLPKTKKHKIRTANAKRAGHVALAVLLDQLLQQESSKERDKTLNLMIGLFRAFGGFTIFVQGRGSRVLLSEAKKSIRALRYVYEIVAFLYRYKKYAGDSVRFDIESAKYFVAKNQHEGDDTYGLSKISKIWERYKNAAPYIFAFYFYLSQGLQQTRSVDDIMHLLHLLAAKQERLTQLIGKAAYVADLLGERARQVRQSDFKKIARVEPRLPPFDLEEQAIINSIDPNAAVP